MALTLTASSLDLQPEAEQVEGQAGSSGSAGRRTPSLPAFAQFWYPKE